MSHKQHTTGEPPSRNPCNPHQPPRSTKESPSIANRPSRPQQPFIITRSIMNMHPSPASSTLRPSSSAQALSWAPRSALARKKTWLNTTQICWGPRNNPQLMPTCKSLLMARTKANKSETRRSAESSRRSVRLPTPPAPLN